MPITRIVMEEWILFSFLLAHEWRKDRKNVNTVFSLSILKLFEPTFNRRFHELTNKIERFVDQPEFELTNHILDCNLNTFMGEFGHSIESEIFN